MSTTAPERRWPDPGVVTALAALRAARPLVHLYTNPVALALTANALTALGAVPAARATVEVPDVGWAGPGAVLVNLGVRGPGSPALWLAAARSARERGAPWVLDPIGANGPYPAARTVAAELLALAPAVLRGNASEVVALAGGPRTGSGPDSALDSADAGPAAAALAARWSTVVTVSGVADLVTDGRRTVLVPGGHPWMPLVSALGCTHGAIVAAFTAVVPAAEAAVAASAVLARAGEIAAARASGPGTLVPHLLDALHALGTDPTPEIP
ncbi:MAG TPA: hydroxyethylthiazole kinase [Cellulomonas sp.]